MVLVSSFLGENLPGQRRDEKFFRLNLALPRLHCPSQGWLHTKGIKHVVESFRQGSWVFLFARIPTRGQQLPHVC